MWIKGAWLLASAFQPPAGQATRKASRPFIHSVCLSYQLPCFLTNTNHNRSFKPEGYALTQGKTYTMRAVAKLSKNTQETAYNWKFFCLAKNEIGLVETVYEPDWSPKEKEVRVGAGVIMWHPAVLLLLLFPCSRVLSPPPSFLPSFARSQSPVARTKPRGNMPAGKEGAARSGDRQDFGEGEEGWAAGQRRRERVCAMEPRRRGGRGGGEEGGGGLLNCPQVLCLLVGT